MPACCVPYCHNRTEKGVRLFMLPQGDRNKERREAWIKNINRDDLSSKAQICEIHFTYDQFENHRQDGKRTLKNNALPTLFDEHKQQFKQDNAKGARRSLRKRKPVVFEEYQSEDEDFKSSQSNNIKKEIEVEENTDKKITAQMKQIELIRCRTCLTTSPKEFSHVLRKLLLGKTIKQVILICGPQMELRDDEYICDKCYRFLVKLMLFIDNCLESEEQLRTGKISLDVSSNDLADINSTNLPKRGRGRPRKYTIRENDKDYEPVDILEKTPIKRGPKRKADIQADNEEDCIADSIGLKWGIPEGKTVTVRKYEKHKSSNDHLPEVENEKNESITVIVSLNGDSNNELNDSSGKSNNKLNISCDETNEELTVSIGESNRKLNSSCDKPSRELKIPVVKSNNEPNNSSVSVGNIEIHNETEMFIDHKENNIINESLELTDSILESFMSPKETENDSKIVRSDHSLQDDLVQLLRCPQCITDYRSLRGIKSHLTSTHKIAEEQIFKCSLCNMKFIRYKDLVKHRSSHGHACELCEDFFPTAAELNTHRLIHPERYCCMKCGEKFQKKALLEKHLPLHQLMTKIRLFMKNATKSVVKCSYCNLKCSSASALQQHINSVHLKIKEYECGICNEKFTSSNNLKVHVRICHSTEPYVCEKCGMGYGQLDDLQRHEQTHSAEHNLLENPAKKSYSRVPSKDKSFGCIFCSVKTSSKQELLVHLQTHKELKKFDGSTYSNLHKYSTCSQNFSTEEEWKIHENECTSQTFTCIICDWVYSREALLEAHILNEHVNKIQTSRDEDNSEIDQIEVNRRNIEMEWSTDEEEEEKELSTLSNEVNQNKKNAEELIEEEMYTSI